MRTGTGRTKYGHKREGHTGHGEHRSDRRQHKFTCCSFSFLVYPCALKHISIKLLCLEQED